jgi:predicted phosphodiesterase
LRGEFYTLGPEVRGRFKTIDIDNVKITFDHGDELGGLLALETMQSYDLVGFGHPHSLSHTQSSRTIMLNAGEVCGDLSGN